MSVGKANLLTKSDQLIDELYETEKTYLRNIEFLDNFLTKIENSTENDDDLTAYRFKQSKKGKEFIAEMKKIGPIKRLSGLLKPALEQSSANSLRVGEIFLNGMLDFNSYSEYLASYSRIVELCQSLKEKNENFKVLTDTFEKENTKENTKEGALSFESFLILPVQRLPRYKMLLEELLKSEQNTLKKLQAEDPEYSKVVDTVVALEKSVEKVKGSAALVNSAITFKDVLTHHDYSSDENRALRSVPKPGDISGLFNTDEDLEKLKEELEKNEALKGLLKNQKMTLTYDKDLLGRKKAPVIIRCMLNGQPLYKIAQETGKNGEKIFYVRIKTKLKTLKSGDEKTLDYDAIKGQLEIAQAVSNVVVDMVENQKKLVSASRQEPFEGYTKVVDEAVGTDGAQTKGGDSGYYIGPDGKTTYYIKCAQEKNVDDDVAEVITSRLNALAMGTERAVQYKTVYNKNNNTVYVASQVSPGFKKIKEVVKLPIPLKKADLIFPANKDAVYAALTAGQRKEMARVLAGSLWVRDIDPQYGNILLNTDKEDGKIPRQNSEGLDTVKKFDNGWGLSRICKPKHAQVRLFESHSPLHIEPVGTHGRTKIPTNHFNDYPKIIRSQDFVEALANTVQELTKEKIEEVVASSMDEIKEAYGKDEFGNSTNSSYWTTLELFAQHMNLDITEHDYSTKALADHIKSTLSTRLQERAVSMALLQRMLAIDLALKDGNIREVGRLATELQSVVYEQYKDEKGKAMLLKDILPPYDPSFDKLMESATKLMEKDPSLNKDERDAISFCTDLSKESNAEKTLAQEAPWFQKEDEGWKPPEPELLALPSELQRRLLAAENSLQHDLNLGNNPKVTPLALPVLNESSKTHVTTAKDQTSETFSKYCESLKKKLGDDSVASAHSENSRTRAIVVTSESTMPAGSKPGTGKSGYLITVTHSQDDSIRTNFSSISDEWKKIFSRVLKANIEAGLTRLEPSGSFEHIKYMTKEILKENLTPVFSPETKKRLEAHKDGGNEDVFLKKVRDEIKAEKLEAEKVEAEKSPGQPSHIISKL